ncbi:glycosyltransferase [Candidatus Falkowbacteria bacterium]|nr:glycosyltransferase [Candidatus Falkowbacteria bacterium]
MKTDLKVALVHDQLNQAGGAERVLLALTHLFPQAPIYTLLYDKERLGGFEDKKVVPSFIQKLPFAKTLFKWYLPFMPSAVEALDLTGYDLVISSSSALIKGVITGPETLHICYCHTPTRYLWTDSAEYVKSLRVPTFIKAMLTHYLSKLRSWDQLASQRVDHYIANSQCVADRIKNYYHQDAHVVYPPVDVHNYTNASKKENYFVMVGRLRPYKKFDLAIQAFNRLKLPLKIIGTGEQEQELKKLAGPTIEFLGHLNEEQKREVVSKARAFINPQVEDFGITAVEALAAGTPVIAYGKGGAREIVTPGVTGEFMKYQNWESLVDVILSFDDKRYQPQALKDAAQRYSTEKFFETWQTTLQTLTQLHEKNWN